ncbi:rhodanese-like domain-containing protein [Brachybacterium sp. FME24]|uniref:rhodanese-like domain-containing protein n=1 Tax=Brachybacterium sp. FME24 TaxID=2742605 RepID=UPI001868D670|nr:rhodanese-like domain-containing protein [Brachybacterium sp. FME24]
MTETSAGRRRAETPARHSIDEILAAARQSVERIEPAALSTLIEQGAHVIDIRPAARRESEGHIPGATVIDRLVLEWRLDPQSADRMDEGPDHDDLVIVVCNEGYYSSLAARDLRDLGFHRATDLVGGFRAYRDAELPTTPEPTHEVS